MEKVNEIISLENSFFGTMKADYETIYTKLFGEIEPSDMDMNLLVQCGNRYCSPLLSHYPMKKVVSFIVNKYGESWERIKETLSLDYDVLKPYSNTTTTKSTKTANSTNNETSEETNGIIGFDSETITDSDTTHATSNNSTDETQTDNTTVINGGNLGSRTNADLITNEIEMRKVSFVSLALNDIQSQLTLDIY